MPSGGVITWSDVSRPSIPPVSRYSGLPGGVAAAVARLERAVGRRPGSAKRAAPSAGACYPCEIVLAPVDHTALALVDLQQRRLLVRSAERECWNGDAFVYFLVGRPWLSMRRYGRRGYLYHLLDAGHAMLNLAVAAADPPRDFRVPREVLRRAEEYAAQRAASVLAVGLLDRGGPGEAGARWMLQETTRLPVPLSDVEMMITSVLPPTPRPVWLRLDDDPDVAALAAALRQRHSASVLDAMPDTGGLGDALAQTEKLCRRLVPALDLPVPEVRVFSRHPGLGATLPATTWVTQAILGQSDLVNASTFVVFQAEVPDKANGVLSPEAQRTVMACGMAGEIGYLVAARSGLGMTGIGGFDPVMWARQCGTAEDVLFLLAFGQERSGEKADATGAGGNHGR
ncbi:hypothetical protein [Actinophytocola oryzae]|uniref:Nitroreductase family protein n=1 Tax=Actinophytocola oryzae TaxID=502181 RepID=A0A4R7VKI0_9PSEU|nr:hypothetical protein [Actinophytocola oryzae]TDV49755.1 hypothetical protein CLV71_10794 [Actinophytocola oryzae]